jgi:hypothetical protein
MVEQEIGVCHQEHHQGDLQQQHSMCQQELLQLPSQHVLSGETTRGICCNTAVHHQHESEQG